MNRELLLGGLAACLALSISFNVAAGEEGGVASGVSEEQAKAIANAVKGALIEEQTEAALKIANAIIKNQPKVVDETIKTTFADGLWKYENAEDAFKILNHLGKLVVDTVLFRTNNQQKYLHNKAGKKFADIILERDNALKNALPPISKYREKEQIERPFWKDLLLPEK